MMTRRELEESGFCKDEIDELIYTGALETIVSKSPAVIAVPPPPRKVKRKPASVLEWVNPDNPEKSNKLPTVKPKKDLYSPRQKDILKLISLGLGNYEIASDLGISYEAVRGSIRAIYGKCEHSKAKGKAARTVLVRGFYLEKISRVFSGESFESVFYDEIEVVKSRDN